jgi:hypothetical protein
MSVAPLEAKLDLPSGRCMPLHAGRGRWPAFLLEAGRPNPKGVGYEPV